MEIALIVSSLVVIVMLIITVIGYWINKLNRF